MCSLLKTPERGPLLSYYKQAIQFQRRFRRQVYLRYLSIVVMRDILQSRYLRRRLAHKQLARTSLRVELFSEGSVMLT